MNPSSFLVDVPALDWLTLTSFTPEDWDIFAASVGFVKDGEWRVRNYRGFAGDIAGAAMAEQAGQVHYLYQATGGDASRAGILLAGRTAARCTRVDVQWTIPLPSGWSARSLVDSLRGADWNTHERAKKRSVRLFENDDGFDTVYIGAASSERQIRIYVKLAEDGERWLRFEVQYRRPLSEQVWSDYQERPSSLANVISLEVGRLPVVPGLSEFRRLVAGMLGSSLKIPRHVPSGDTALAWLESAALPVFRRMLNSHEASERAGARSLLHRLNAWAMIDQN